MDIRLQLDCDEAAVAGLMRAAFGGEHGRRAVWHLRSGAPIQSLCLVALKHNKICGSLRFWQVLVCNRPQLLLGPLAVLPDRHGQGFGRALVADGLRRAEQHDRWEFVLVSGDPEYYPKFGFRHVADKQFIWPGEIAPNQLQIRALRKTGPADLSPGPMAILPLAGQVVDTQ